MAQTSGARAGSRESRLFPITTGLAASLVVALVGGITLVLARDSLLSVRRFGLAFWYSAKNRFQDQRWLLKWALWFIPMPWIAAELGWFVAEYGRQPWSIFGVLPTHLSASTLSAGSLYGSIAGFIGFYTLLLVAEMYLMFKFARLGPSSLGTGKYHFEHQAIAA